MSNLVSTGNHKGLSEEQMRTLYPKSKELYALTGCCASWVDFSVDEKNRIRSITLIGGCPGMRSGLCALIEGRDIHVVIKALRGIKCRATGSCPDQIARALQKYLRKDDPATEDDE